MKKTALSLVLVTSFFAAPAAMAQAYVSANVGSGHSNVDCAGTSSCRANGTAFKATGGYVFGSGVSAELGYLNFGNASASGLGYSAELRTTAITFSAAYTAKAGDSWAFTGRAGIAAVKSKFEASSGAVTGSLSTTKTAPVVGIGVSYALSSNVKLIADADFTRAELDGDRYNVRALTAGLRFDF